MKPLLRISIIAPIVLALTACGGADTTSKQKSAATTPAASVGHDEARALFESLCFTCHGSTGKGDGPGAVALNPKPRSFSDPTWQDSVDDAHIEKVILYGGSGVGKSPMMPAQPHLKGKTELLKALIKIVRGFRGQ